MRECFNQADRLSKVIDASPLVTAAVYRLLFAIMQRAVPVRDVEDWQDRWDEQAFQSDVSDYLDRFYHRFDLFDEQLPFAQAVDMPENCRLFPWTKLAMELPPNSSKLLFDHTNTTEPQAASPAEAVRYLCASLAFTVGAGRSCTGYTAHAPLTSALVIIPEGRDLAETLLANLLPSPVNDEPIWERPALSAQDLTSSSLVWTGPASRLTWPSRAIRFLPEEDGAIRWIQFGMGLPTPDIEGDRDPWVAYHVTRDGKRIARKLVPDRMIWRDFHSFWVGCSAAASSRLVSRLSGLSGWR